MAAFCFLPVICQQIFTPLYYDLKNALVNDDAASASKKAEALLNAINAVNLKTLSGKEHDIFVSLKDKLSYDIRQIAEVEKIDHQREHFANLSLNMYTLAKSAKLTKSACLRGLLTHEKSLLAE
ncbi:MAG TPA: DUF3347 domain-containing protein [Puia sp.]|nr:DUF3347 domain-containing protein [Puia sp.]